MAVEHFGGELLEGQEAFGAIALQRATVRENFGPVFNEDGSEVFWEAFYLDFVPFYIPRQGNLVHVQARKNFVVVLGN